MRRRRRNDGDDDDEEEEEGGEAHLGRTMATANELPYAFPADRRGLEKKNVHYSTRFRFYRPYAEQRRQRFVSSFLLFKKTTTTERVALLVAIVIRLMMIIIILIKSSSEGTLCVCVSVVALEHGGAVRHRRRG